MLALGKTVHHMVSVPLVALAGMFFGCHLDSQQCLVLSQKQDQQQSVLQDLSHNTHTRTQGTYYHIIIMGVATTFFSTTSGSTAAGASFSAWLQELASPYLSWVDNQWLTLMSKTTLSDALVFTVRLYTYTHAVHLHRHKPSPSMHLCLSLSLSNADTHTHTQIGTYIIHEVMSAFFATFYCLAHYRGWFKEYRIQTQASFDMKLFKVALREFLKRTFITDFPAMLLMYYGFRHFGTRVREPLPPASTILWHWTLSWLWTETTFYWSHRSEF